MKIKVWIFLFVSFGVGISVQAANLDTRMGAEAADQIEKQMGLTTHSSANIYVQKIGRRLVSKLGKQPFDYEFHIVDMEEPNAFALPGGIVYFSRGIILLANSEDEMAGVMGHEIIHAHKRHSVKAMRRSIVPGLLKLPGNIVGLVSTRLGQLVNLPVEGVTGLTFSRYTRKQESQSDRLGVELAADSGYDPRALASLLTNMSKSEEIITGEKEKFSYYNGHPYTPKRVKNIEKISKKLKVANIPSIASDQAAFLKKFEGLVIGPNPAYGLFFENKFIQPEMNFSLVFPKGWETINSPSLVGAFEPNKEAQLFVGVSQERGTPELAAKKIYQATEEKKGSRAHGSA